MTAIMLFHNLNKATMSVDWLGLHIECKMPHRNSKRDKAKLDYITKASVPAPCSAPWRQSFPSS